MVQNFNPNIRYIWGAIIGAAASLASQGLGAWQSAKAAKEAKNNTQGLLADNQAWYDRRYNEDPTQRADAQYVLNHLSEELRKRNKAAEGKAAVVGGSDAAVAAEKAANNEAYANAVGNIAAQNAARKDEIEDKYMTAKTNLTGQLSNIETQRAANIGAAGTAAGTALGTAGNSVDDYLDALGKRKTIGDNNNAQNQWIGDN